MFRDSHPVLALIPARGGSKGVPRKNLASLCGRPLLEYTVRAAVDCAAIDASYVSSDDAEILEVARRLGARAMERPPAFVTDAASAIEVVRHFIETLPAELRARDPLIVYLQPTSPLRDAQHLDAAFDLLARHDATTLMSVVELEKSPFKAFGLDEQQRLRSLFDERLSNARRQDLPPAFLPNGAIYIFAASDFLSRDGFPSNGSVPYLMSAADSIDIDTPDDLRRVERILGDKHG